jgi:CubicO group peptidase (beta-lactamase class C family)
MTAKRGLIAIFSLMGMSINKTAAGAAVGALLCDGRLKSLVDKAGDCSSLLKTTPYRDVSVRSILQMNSGVSPIGRSDQKRFNRKACSLLKFSGAADVRGALKSYKTAARKQGKTMNYHSSDLLALSVLVKEISGKPLSDVSYQHIFQKFTGDGHMHWTTDKSGTTVAYADLVITAKDWARLGWFIMTKRRQDSCLGAFFLAMA